MTNKKLYLIGDPVDHSLSPLLHGAMIAQTGVHYTYEVRRVQPRDLADFVAEAKAGGCAGFNVTMPHKEAILPLLDELSPAAAACGAVNTVCIKNGRAIGYNTDGRGFVDSLRARGLEPEGKTVLLLGTGGAGDAICDALVGAGVKKIFVTNRSVYPAQDLAARYPDKAQFIYFGIFPVRHAMAESDLFINATSLGMAGMKEFSDLGFLRDAPAGVTVYDLVYNPRQTKSAACPPCPASTCCSTRRPVPSRCSPARTWICPPCSRRWRASWTEVDTRPARLYNTRRLFTFSLRYFL